MNKLLLLLFLCTAAILIPTGCRDNNLIIEEPYSLTHKTAEYSGDLLHEWIDVCYQMIRDNNLQGPQAARIYGYIGLTAWESTFHGIPGAYSMATQINTFPETASFDSKIIYDWGIVLAAAMETVLPEMIDQLSSAQRNQIEILSDAQITQMMDKGLSDQVKVNSREFGIRVGLRILQRMRNDGRDIIKNIIPQLPMRDPAHPWYWENTGSPVEPLWGTIQTFATTNSQFCEADSPWAYSTEASEQFYIEAQEIADIPKNTANKVIAYHWEDGPGSTFCPADHWMSITEQLLKDQNKDLAACAKTYCMAGFAAADATSASWYIKYKYNLMRPVTFIRENIKADWVPLLFTPSYPEYTSDAATIGGALPEVLVPLLGNVAFTDKTHLGAPVYTPDGGPFVLSERAFTSLTAAGEEQAESQVLGGIHFRRSSVQGLDAGRCIGRTIRNRLNFGY